jgi:PAS domain S-box-containing protein
MQLSLYQLLRLELGDKLPIIRCTKSTLVHLSHTLEDMVLTRELPALMFTGFQESSYWRAETQRYRTLATLAQQVCIFAGKPLPPDSAANALQITLASDDPLRQEWFLLILTEQFAVLLCGQDQLTFAEDEALRQFDTILSFDPDVIAPSLDLLDGVIARYRPDLLDQLQAARRRFPLVSPPIEVVQALLFNVMRFEENLNTALADAHRREVMARQQLAESEERFRLIAETANDAIIIIDAAGNLHYANPVVEGLFGYAPAELVGLPVVSIIPTFSLDLFEITPSEEHSPPVDLFAVQRDGTSLPVSVTLSQFSQQGEIVYAGIVRSLADRLRVEQLVLAREKMRLALELERQMGALRVQFLNTLSHEFRTPLSIIAMAVDMLEYYSPRMTPERQKEGYSQIRAQIQFLQGVLEDIIVINRVQSGRLEPQIAPLNLETAVNEIAAASHSYDDISGRVVMRYSGSNEPFFTDAKLLRYILSNLISNAVKYSPPDTPVDVRVNHDDSTAIIAVTDQGIGIPDADQSKVMEAFYRASNVAYIAGTGLGLRIVADCVSILEGAIGFTSQEGVGTTFTVRLPSLKPA